MLKKGGKMDLIAGLFRIIIIRFLGINVRYFFLKLFDKNTKKENLSSNQSDMEKAATQDFYNAVIGFLILIIIVLLMAYILGWGNPPKK